MRWLLGLAAIGFLVAGGAAWQADDATLAGILIRVGIVLAAVWLGLPAIERIDRRNVWIVLVVLGVVLVRPRSAIIVLPVLAWFVTTTRRRPDE